jgi:hypothetical protein
MANRADAASRSGRDDGRELSLISLARETTRLLDCLRTDLEPDDERILNSLTQFDLPSCVAAISAANATDASGTFYTHFASFYGSRTQPIVERPLTDPQLRRHIHPQDDEHLARNLALIDRYARQVGFRYDGWEGYSHPVNAFIDRSLPRGGESQTTSAAG